MIRPLAFSAAAGLALVLAAAPASAQAYRFPTSSADYAEFYPTAYRDNTGPGGGLEDWNCGTNTYDGHRGSDFGFGSWGGMSAGRDIVAAADGTVIYVNDGCADMCSTADCGCGGGFGNYVRLEHADGKTTYYAHMAIWSITVAVGDTVICGQLLGLGGSSGNSSGPHLHFEVHPPGCDAGSCSEDPFDGPCSGPPSYWVDQGVYNLAPSLDCDGGAPPPPPPPCSPAAGAPACGTSAGGANDAPGSTSVVSSYACVGWDYPGPEYAYTFTAATTEPVTATVSGLGADLDLFVLDAACNPDACLASSDNPMTSDETVTFMAAAGSTYALVIDGYAGAVSGFTLSLSCTGPVIEPPPPTGAPDLSMEITIDDIPGQVRDFETGGTSAGIFDLYSEQVVVHRLYVRNAAGATARAENVRIGLWVEEPWLRVVRWDVYDDWSGNACGGAWCSNDSNGDAANPPHDDPGQTFDLVLRGFGAGESKMIELTIVAGPESAGVDHPDIRAWVEHVDGFYERESFDTPASFNVGQTWNGGDLRVWSQSDVWVWDGPGTPPSGGLASWTVYDLSNLDEGDGGLLGACSCHVVGSRSNRAATGAPTGAATTAVVLALGLAAGLVRLRRARPRA